MTIGRRHAQTTQHAVYPAGVYTSCCLLQDRQRLLKDGCWLFAGCVNLDKTKGYGSIAQRVSSNSIMKLVQPALVGYVMLLNL